MLKIKAVWNKKKKKKKRDRERESGGGKLPELKNKGIEMKGKETSFGE